MNLIASLQSIGVLLAAIGVFSLIEALIPLRARGVAGRRHLAPNLALTLITFASNFVLNIPLLLGLAWLHGRGLGLFNAIAVPSAVAVLGSVVALDFAWYVTHVTLHRVPALWRFHAVHHCDVTVDVTTTIRQHPGESLIRYGFLAAFAFAAGVPVAGFALYRIWSALHGQIEHANIRLPQGLDTAITWLFSSPNMHKIHHTRDPALADRNYANIFSGWDRLFGTFTPSREGREVDYGLEGFDGEGARSTLELLAMPFRTPPNSTASPRPGAR